MGKLGWLYMIPDVFHFTCHCRSIRKICKTLKRKKNEQEFNNVHLPVFLRDILDFPWYYKI